MTTPPAKRVVLELLTAIDGHEASAAGLVLGAGVVGVSENSVRVTLTRLVAAGTLEVTGRGQYKLGARTRALTARITSWRELERQVRMWDGGWAMAHVAGGRDGRRDRALELLGFRALDGGVLVRPDNLVGGVAALRARLAELGAPLLVARLGDLDDATEARARTLWDGERLDATYVKLRERMDGWVERVDELPLRRAAKEAFLIGGEEVLHAILYDPRLPSPLVDVGARRAMVDAMIRFDRVGRGLWERVAKEYANAA